MFLSGTIAVFFKVFSKVNKILTKLTCDLQLFQLNGGRHKSHNQRKLSILNIWCFETASSLVLLVKKYSVPYSFQTQRTVLSWCELVTWLRLSSPLMCKWKKKSAMYCRNALWGWLLSKHACSAFQWQCCACPAGEIYHVEQGCSSLPSLPVNCLPATALSFKCTTKYFHDTFAMYFYMYMCDDPHH